jgi:hypothetical protein
VPFWSLVFVFSKTLNFFELTTDIMIAFTSSFCILQMVENESRPSQSIRYWILLGMFFYFFSVFIIKGTSFSQWAVKAWYLHNIFNVTTNLIYFYGFLRTRHFLSKSQPS